ncbi:hypothetical protein ACFQE1_00340 [Halobium palmae]|uniref:DUF8156 domain-containing protein n=1 Tax=Halobium palmae TaxID=1776492 RepID=A0ABD5RTZ0_9EURY
MTQHAAPGHCLNPTDPRWTYLMAINIEMQREIDELREYVEELDSTQEELTGRGYTSWRDRSDE